MDSHESVWKILGAHGTSLIMASYSEHKGHHWLEQYSHNNTAPMIYIALAIIYSGSSSIKVVLHYWHPSLPQGIAYSSQRC